MSSPITSTIKECRWRRFTGRGWWSARYEAAGPPDYQGVPVAEVYREGMVACEVRSGRAGYHFPITCHNFNHVNGYNIPTIQLSSYVMIELYSITYL